MKRQMSVLEAKEQLKEVMEYVRETGKEVILTKNGAPYVIMKPLEEALESDMRSRKK